MALAKFESLVNQIQKNAKDIDIRIQRIKAAQLFHRPPLKIDGSLHSVKVGKRLANSSIRLSKRLFKLPVLVFIEQLRTRAQAQGYLVGEVVAFVEVLTKG